MLLVMQSITSLLPGRTYQVIREFIDYEQRVHAVGETWTFIFSKFVPYDDGMMLHISQNGELGYFQHHWAVYDKRGQKCPGCSCDIKKTGGIRKFTQGARSTFHCPQKQK